MKTRQTWAEIRSMYPDEWVLLTDVEDDEAEPEITSGVVVDHGMDEEAVLARTKGTSNDSSQAILFTGEVGKGSFLF